MEEIEYLKKAVEGLTAIVSQLVEERKTKASGEEKPKTAEQKAIEDKEIQDVLDSIRV